MNLTITDGFKMGCGLLLALATAGAVLLVLAAVASFASAAWGLHLPFFGS
jgi:hypothetical protein